MKSKLITTADFNLMIALARTDLENNSRSNNPKDLFTNGPRSSKLGNDGSTLRGSIDNGFVFTDSDGYETLTVTLEEFSDIASQNLVEYNKWIKNSMKEDKVSSSLFENIFVDNAGQKTKEKYMTENNLPKNINEFLLRSKKNNECVKGYLSSDVVFILKTDKNISGLRSELNSEVQEINSEVKGGKVSFLAAKKEHEDKIAEAKKEHEYRLAEAEKVAEKQGEQERLKFLKMEEERKKTPEYIKARAEKLSSVNHVYIEENLDENKAKYVRSNEMDEKRKKNPKYIEARGEKLSIVNNVYIEENLDENKAKYVRSNEMDDFIDKIQIEKEKKSKDQDLTYNTIKPTIKNLEKKI
jgi:hypothetical protein